MTESRYGYMKDEVIDAVLEEISYPEKDCERCGRKMVTKEQARKASRQEMLELWDEGYEVERGNICVPCGYHVKHGHPELTPDELHHRDAKRSRPYDYARMAADGMDVEDIAKHFGITKHALIRQVRVWQQRGWIS